MMRAPLTLILLLSIVCQDALPSGSASVNDSLRACLKSEKFKNRQEEYNIIGKLYDSYLISDLPSALFVARKQYKLAGRNNDKMEKGVAAGWMGYVFYKQGLNDSSLIFLNEALSYYSASGDNAKTAETRNNIANVFRITAKYDTAMYIYTDLLKYYESEKDLIMQGKILANIGSVYYTAGNQDKGKEFTLKALEMQRKTGDSRGSAVSLVNLSLFALNKGQYKEGIKFGEEALLLLKEIDLNYYAGALLRVGYCYYMSDNRDKALDYTRKAIAIYRANDNISGMMEAYRSLADYLIDMGKYSEALKQGKEALAVADTTNRLDLRLLYDILKRAAIYLNQTDDAIYYSDEQIRLKEEDMNQEVGRKDCRGRGKV